MRLKDEPINERKVSEIKEHLDKLLAMGGWELRGVSVQHYSDDIDVWRIDRFMRLAPSYIATLLDQYEFDDETEEDTNSRRAKADQIAGNGAGCGVPLWALIAAMYFIGTVIAFIIILWG